MSQYLREQWNTESTFPGGAVNAIGQTSDGYLWIGTDTGLIRFDGFGFTHVPLSSIADARKAPILGLLADVDGNLWVRVQGLDLLRQKAGRFESVAYGGRTLSSAVTAISRNTNGAVLVSDVIQGTFRFDGQQVQKLAVPDILPGSSPVISIAETSKGKIWMGTLGAGLFLFEGGRAGAVNAGLPERKINCLLAIGTDELWVGTDNGLYRWKGKSFRQMPLPASFRNVQVLSLLRDRDSNFWVGTASGLVRINAKGASFSYEEQLRGSGGINALFEDREGNIWVGGARGLGRIRDTAFLTYSSATDPRFDRAGAIYVDASNRTWFAGAQGGLYTLKGGRPEPVKNAVPTSDVVYSIVGSGDEMWVGRQRGGLTHLQFRNGTMSSHTYTQANGLAQNSVYAVMKSRDGVVWAGTLSGGISRLSDGHFTTYTAVSGLAANAVSSILETRDGTIWFATSNGVSSLSNHQWRSYGIHDGLPTVIVHCLFEDSSGTLWAGTSSGLAFLSDRGFQVPSSPEVLREPIFGLVEDRNGWFWIATSNHVLQVPREKLAKGSVGLTDIREYGPANGLPSSEGVNRSRSVVSEPEGRIWISLKGGLSVVDPSHLAISWPPAIPHIETVTADGVPIKAVEPVHVPASPKRITFAYTALSLALPERIRFRYFVDNFDRQWSEPTSSREAVYTNLSPGTYRFRLLASNSYGEWNGSESTVTFEVEPAFWQTWWFRFALLVFAASLALVLYRFHLHRLTQELNMRFEERLAERTRIAQELHDTLLQGFLSASMQLHVADDQIPDDSPAKPLLTRVLGLMGQVIEEGRNAVRGLRSANYDSSDLGQTFSRIPQGLGIQQEVEFRVIVEGLPRRLHPIIRDEVYRIGRESLANAFRHSRATMIEVEIEYSASDLRVLIRDNGCGIDPQVLSSGREGHWGLSGMKERTERMGGKLRVLSHPDAGTEVELLVPAQIAFQVPAKDRATTWLSRIYPRRRRNETSQPGGEQTQ